MEMKKRDFRNSGLASFRERVFCCKIKTFFTYRYNCEIDFKEGPESVRKRFD